MKYLSKQYMKLIVAIVIICSIGGGIAACVRVSIIPDNEKFEKEYLELQKYFQIIIKYIKDENWNHFSTISGSGTSVEIRQQNSREIEIIRINEEEVIQAISILYTNKYTDIYKEGNAIWFHKDIAFRNGIGIAYSLDGEPPNNGLVGKLKPFAQDGWYFYSEK